LVSRCRAKAEVPTARGFPGRTAQGRGFTGRCGGHGAGHQPRHRHRLDVVEDQKKHHKLRQKACSDLRTNRLLATWGSGVNGSLKAREAAQPAAPQHAPARGQLRRPLVRPPSAPAFEKRQGRTASEPATRPEKAAFPGVLSRKKPRLTMLGQRHSPSRNTPPHAGHQTPITGRQVALTHSPAAKRNARCVPKPPSTTFLRKVACFLGVSRIAGPNRRWRAAHHLGVGLKNARQGVSCPPSPAGFAARA